MNISMLFLNSLEATSSSMAS